MELVRGMLYLRDPLCADAQGQAEMPALVFNENERCLSRAQEALWQMRRRHGWVCVAAEGAACAIAAALAAQLPVDRLALRDASLLTGRNRLAQTARGRELLRVARYARRNASLIASELVLTNVSDAEIGAWARLFGMARVCVLAADAWRPCVGDEPLLCAPWQRLYEKNLLISGKCV